MATDEKRIDRAFCFWQDGFTSAVDFTHRGKSSRIYDILIKKGILERDNRPVGWGICFHLTELGKTIFANWKAKLDELDDNGNPATLSIYV